MRSPESLPSVRFDLAPSPTLAGLLLTGHLAAGAALHAAVGGLAGAGLALASAALGAASAWSRALHRAGGSVRSIEVAGERMRIVLRGGATREAPVAPRRYVSPWLVTIALRAPVRRTILITPDMLGQDAFRRLRLWALWGRLPPSAVQLEPAPDGVRTPTA